MIKQNIKTSAFSLAKKKDLIGDDFYDVKIINDLCIAIVCDGVGSAIEGRDAAKRTSTYLMNSFKNRPLTWSIEKSIKKFISSINSILYNESIINYQRAELVTTLTIVVIHGNKLYGANVGDSRVYLKRNNELNQLSQDHSMQEKGFENVLTQAIGISQDISEYYFENIIQKDDKILLCSDGLYNTLNNDIFLQNINLGANFLVKKASKLSNDNLEDDTTAVVIEILQENQIEILKSLNLKIPENLEINDNIDGYILKKSLIQNNRTWLCSKKGKEYVLKFPLFEASYDEKILDLYINESWNSKRLKAGFFPKAVIPKKRSKRYYVMENIDGIDLNTYLNKRKLHVDDAINLAKTLLNMSQYLLKYDLVHGDIKPDNIMQINRKGKNIFKIIDFGSMREIYSIDSVIGTPSYVSPERFKGSSINEASEIFSIGVTLYKVLTNKYPYGEIEPFQTPKFNFIASAKSINNNIPTWLNSIILRAISLDLNTRYKNYSEMIFELENSNKVKPFFNKEISIIKKNPVFVYKSSFIFMLFVNIILLYLLLK